MSRISMSRISMSRISMSRIYMSRISRIHHDRNWRLFSEIFTPAGVILAFQKIAVVREDRQNKAPERIVKTGLLVR